MSRYLLNSTLILLFLLSSESVADALARKTAKANRLFKKNKLEEALKLYRDAQIESPEVPELHYNIGNVLYRKKRYQEALTEFNKALNTNNPELQQKAYYNLGNCNYRLGEQLLKMGKSESIEKFKQAIEAYKKALELNSQDMDAKYNIEFIEK